MLGRMNSDSMGAFLHSAEEAVSFNGTLPGNVSLYIGTWRDCTHDGHIVGGFITYLYEASMDVGGVGGERKELEVTRS